jgi:cobalt-zinc-cadmium efflux system outer membrane protein
MFIDVHAQNIKTDTINITLEEAEARFLQNNFQLLAFKFNIEASKAATIQAKLWNNPNIAVEQNVYNWDTKKWFDVTSSGNTEIAVQQLILLAGKRNKQVNLTEINAKNTELQFYDLVRNIKFTLRKNFYDLFYFQKSLKFYDGSIESVQKTVTATEAIYQSRSILLSEIFRLKSLLFSLQSDRQNLIGQINTIQSNFRTLLSDTSKRLTYYIPKKDISILDTLSIENKRIDELLDNGLESRPDYQLAKNTVLYEEKNLEYQKVLAVPDLTIGGRWSRAGSYITNYYAVTFSIDIPVFNRNQGNIQVSEATLKQDKVNADNIKTTIESDIITAYQNVISYDKLYKTLDKTLVEQYASLVQDMIENYQKRNITIIELTDFYESYRNIMLQINQLQNSRVDALESLNLSVGTDIIKY